MNDAITNIIRNASLCAVAVAAAVGAPKASLAATVDVTGGNGLDIGYLCTTGQVCPGASPAFTLSGTDPVSGSFIYTPGLAGTGTVSFVLSLNSDAIFGGETLLAGSTFSAASVAVTATPTGTGNAVRLQESGSATGSASLVFNPGLATITNSPLISGLMCTIGTGSDQCGFSFGALGLELGPSGGNVNYNSFLTFNVNTTPVPLPAAAWLLLSGMGALGALRRRRRLAV
jgi:hypothetical protein